MTHPDPSLIDDLTRGPGSRELSNRVLVALGFKLSLTAMNGEVIPVGLPLPDPSRNLQDAVDLVPEEQGTNKAAFIHAAFWQRRIGDIPDDALARFACIALIKARSLT